MNYVTDADFERDTGKKVIHSYPKLDRTEQVIGIANELLPEAVQQRIDEYPELHLKPEDFTLTGVFTHKNIDGKPAYTFQVHTRTGAGIITAWVQMVQVV